MKLTAQLQSPGPYGTPRPQLRLEAPGAHYRAVAAALHLIAAEVERFSAQTDERWVVVIALGNVSGFVQLELIEADAAEVSTAMNLLDRVAAFPALLDQLETALRR